MQSMSTHGDPKKGDGESNKRWVWYSTGESIAAGKTSVLAVIEIPAAMALFWGLARFPAPWLTLLAFIAVPLLLMRSPGSVAAGVAALRAFWRRTPHNPKLGIAIAIALSGATCAAGLTYLGAAYWLSGHVAAALYWRVLVLSVGSFVIATGLVCSLFIMFGFVGAFANYFSQVRARVGFPADVASLVLVPFIVAGFVCRIVSIRIVSTLRHWQEGLVQFPLNCFETFFVVDLKHAPELMPGARSVHPLLTVDGIWKSMALPRDDDRASLQRAAAWVIAGAMALMIWFSATVYRVNIKASAFLWGAIALAFSPIVWPDDEDMRTRTSFWTTWSLLGGQLTGFLVLSVWLAVPWITVPLDHVAPGSLAAIAAIAPPPKVGLRYWALCVLCLCLGVLLYYAYAIRAAHSKALEGAGDFKSYGPELQQRMKSMANPVRRWLKINTAVAVLSAWTFTLWAAITYWPGHFPNAAWGWVKPWL
jgi:hypothetical protein